jgi:hypothetical protein
LFGGLLKFVGGMKCTLTGKDGNLLARIENVGGAKNVVLIRLTRGSRREIRYVMRHVSLRPLIAFYFHVPDVGWNGDVGDATIQNSGAAGQFCNILDVSRPPHTLVLLGDIHEKLIGFDILLREVPMRS